MRVWGLDAVELGGVKRYIVQRGRGEWCWEEGEMGVSLQSR